MWDESFCYIFISFLVLWYDLTESKWRTYKIIRLEKVKFIYIWQYLVVPIFTKTENPHTWIFLVLKGCKIRYDEYIRSWRANKIRVEKHKYKVQTLFQSKCYYIKPPTTELRTIYTKNCFLLHSKHCPPQNWSQLVSALYASTRRFCENPTRHK